jgi:hypothetical protein
MPLRRLWIGVAAGLLGACNMVISETPMFAEADRTDVAPRDGIWLNDSDECRFDSSRPESDWPECAMWVVVRDSGRKLEVSDGKKQSQHLRSLFAAGESAIIEAQWTDDAKTPSTVTYGYYALEPQPAEPDGRFIRATVWPVECGIQSGSDIRPFPGITPECRPTSKDAIRAAALSSRRAEQIERWRWLRAERR